MLYYCVFVVFCVCAMSAEGMPSIYTVEIQDNEVHSYNFPFVTRKEWQARTPLKRLSLLTPVPYVVIHHSYIPAACTTQEMCSEAMRVMQGMHIDGRGWWDVGYNFGVGSDGAAYEGRGWSTLGAHALHFNSVSIGICLIGDWRFELPPADQLKTAKALIAAGVELGYIRPDYRLLAHRQVRQTECPGEALYQEIKSWPQYSPFPSTYKDLINSVMEDTFTFVSREEWQARPPKMQNPLDLPVSYVVIHHSYTPPVCYTKKKGCETMRKMQNFHMDDREWVDIGYSFAVGGDGIVYEGRGWTTLAAHAKNFNHVSFGICLIGDWQSALPPPQQLQAVKELLKMGVQKGYLKADYKLIGHRQVRATECPGNALFEHLKTWEHYSAYPASVADLLDIKGIPEDIRADLMSRTAVAVG